VHSFLLGILDDDMDIKIMRRHVFVHMLWLLFVFSPRLKKIFYQQFWNKSIN